MGFRDHKIFIPGRFYHVFNRGNDKMPILQDNQDYWVFLSRLRMVLGLPTSIYGAPSRRIRLHSFPPDSFIVVSYCLMPNHYHLLIKQNTDLSIDKLILKLCTSYVKYFNKKYNKVGHLFQDRFKAKLIDSDAYLTRVSAYIHANPTSPFNYQFSSLPVFITEGKNDFLTVTEPVLSYFASRKAYMEFVMQYWQNKENFKKMAKHTFGIE